MTHLATDSPIAAAIKAKTGVLLVGDWEHREFSVATASIQGAHGWPAVANMDAAEDLLGHCQQPPELIFLAQPFPGLYRQQEIDRLQQLVPLARLIIVAGSWCEGELRTGTPPGGVIRLYWYELASWWQAAVRRRNAGLCPPWSLPLDHPQAGRLPPCKEVLPANNCAHVVLIDAADYAVYETLSAALREYGILSAWNGRHANGPFPATADREAGLGEAGLGASIGAGIWEGGQLSDRERSRLAKFCRQVDGPVIVLLDFPRVEHFELARAAGAAAVFAKPYVVEEVLLAFATVGAKKPGASAQTADFVNPNFQL